MNKPNVTKLLNTAKHVMKKRSPEILTGIGIAGMISTVVLAVKATPKAIELIEEEHLNRIPEDYNPENDQTPDKLTKVDVIKIAWKPYIPAAITGVFSIACIIGASSVHVRRNAALATAYKLSETALTEYKEKVVETIGEKKEKTIREKIAKDKVEQNPASKTEIFVTGNGKSLFLDPLSNRYFESDVEKVRKIINDLNWQMGYGSEMYISLSQLYDELGLSHTKISDSIGWNVSDGNIELDLSAQVADDGRPCLVMDFLKAPTYDFDKYL